MLQTLQLNNANQKNEKKSNMGMTKTEMLANWVPKEKKMR
jgi:hypothetical protein